MEMNPTETIVQACQNMIGSANWRMNLDQFLEALDAPDDDYWRTKFLQFKDLAESFGNFDCGTLSKIILYNERVNLKKAPK